MKLAKIYEPKAYEPGIYALWEEAKAFAPKNDVSKGTFSLVLPPPNANGNLHLGHALTVALEDVAVRYHRLKGESALFLPGADHAGFETWVVVEKTLDSQGKSRFTLSRDSLYKLTWDFVETQRGNMEIQLRELGASLDWDHLTFTLDAKVIKEAYKTFKQLWDDGLVYRGERLVNYCTKHQTSFADIEVKHVQEKTKLWKIAFPLVEKVGELVVATTRPETKLGQSALMVHPDDPRYKQFIGMHVFQPLVPGVKIPIVADKDVDPKFGTGVVTVTPAHDAHDFDVAMRLKLPLIELIGKDGRLTKKVPAAFHGLTVEEARNKVVAALQACDALRGEEDYVHSVSRCYRCNTVIEPMLMEQWFVKVQPLVKKVIAAINAKEVTFTPASKSQALIHYLQNLKDWNISRQIPWGIPIPAFQNSEDSDDWIFDERVNEPTITVNGKTYHREEDTFDTWFSSGQWPFITTDYMNKGELSQFYPLDVMETGFDLLHAWVARMLMLGLYRTKQVPFKHVYLHGMVLDEHGQKMSKSKGNVMNPQDVLQKYGSDALRMGLLANRSPGVSQAFTSGNVVAARNFCNKLWNIARFVEDKLGDNFKDRNPRPVTAADHWVLARLNNASAEIGQLIEQHRYAEAHELMYHTVWDDVADWYIECSKVHNTTSVLAYVLEIILKIAHPFAPFVTETIWQTLGWEQSQLITSTWPEAAPYDTKEAAKFAQLQELVSEIRFVSADLAKGKLRLLVTKDELVEAYPDLLMRLAQLKEVVQVEQGRGLRLAVARHEAWLDIDADTLYQHQTKLEERLVTCRAAISKLEARLTNKNYVANAPAVIVEETKKQLSEQQTIEGRLVRELEVIKK